MVRVSPPSVSSSKMEALPSRCPASIKVAFTPSHTLTVSPYSQVCKNSGTRMASATVYSGSTAGRPARSFLRF